MSQVFYRTTWDSTNMVKKKIERLPSILPKHKEALAILASTKEFTALEQLFRIEENNIVIGSFKVLSSDPEIARKKAWHEGRIYELRKILKTFEEVKKGET